MNRLFKTKVNPFRKFLTAEHLLQEACVIYLKVQYPKVLFTHVPNEGRKTPFERFLYAIMGVKTGITDLLIFKQVYGMLNGVIYNYAGLAIELKVPGKKPTQVQIDCMSELRAAGWRVIVCTTTGEFINEVTDYMRLCKPVF